MRKGEERNKKAHLRVVCLIYNSFGPIWLLILKNSDNFVENNVRKGTLDSMGQVFLFKIGRFFSEIPLLRELHLEYFLLVENKKFVIKGFPQLRDKQFLFLHFAEILRFICKMSYICFVLFFNFFTIKPSLFTEV